MKKEQAAGWDMHVPYCYLIYTMCFLRRHVDVNAWARSGRTRDNLTIAITLEENLQGLQLSNVSISYKDNVFIMQFV